MPVLHFDPRPLLAAVAALLLTIVLAVLAAGPLPTIDFGSADASSSSPSAAAQPAGDPAWVSDPMAPPALLAR